MNSQPEPTVGLSLAGGGYRATLFSLGCLWRLNDAGWLPKLTRVASVSGSSITSAFLAYQWQKLEFKVEGNGHSVAKNFTDEIAEPLRQFCRRTIDFPLILRGLIHPRKSISQLIADTYDEHLFHGKLLRNIPDTESSGRPRFIFYATNLQTGVSFRFTPSYLADYKLGQLHEHKVRLADAVAASTAFPPFLSPFVLSTEPSKWKNGDPKVPNLNLMRKKLFLTDGGVYDNLGLEAIWKRYDIVLAFDAGGPFREKARVPRFWPSQLGRVRNIMMEQTRALRRRMLMAQITSGSKRGTYHRIRSEIANFGLGSPMTSDSDLTRSLQHIRTRLNHFTDEEQGHLINWGYALSDTALRRHVDETIPIGTWPDQNYPLEAPK